MATKKPTPPTATAAQPEKKPVKWYDSWAFLIGICIILPLLFRSVAYSPFHIPSGSMKSTLLEGDYIFVSKFSYGFSRYSFPFSPKLFEGRIWFTPPKRGDIIVFRPPFDPKTDFIKRLVGLPGDRIKVQNGELYINGSRLPRTKVEPFLEPQKDGSVKHYLRFEEKLPPGNGGAEVVHHALDISPVALLDFTDEFIVPEKHYFMMGDNRDESQDSRAAQVGMIPEENLVGRAEVIFFSTREPLLRFWAWPNSFRANRFLKDLEGTNSSVTAP